MTKETKFNSKSLLEIKFEKDVKGYNPLQVDETLDDVIEDYKMYENEVSNANEEIAKLTKKLDSLKSKVHAYEIELATCKSQLKNVSSSGNYSNDNISLLKRIDALERALYLKGVDPKKI